MKLLDNTPMDKPHRTLLETIMLSTMELILKEGIDYLLEQFVGITKEQCKMFPTVEKTMKEKGLL